MLRKLIVASLLGSSCFLASGLAAPAESVARSTTQDVAATNKVYVVYYKSRNLQTGGWGWFEAIRTTYLADALFKIHELEQDHYQIWYDFTQ